MKKKFNLWLNIVTICLCVCAIAIGVYAATTATLTVSGKVGFTPHGCEGSVTGTIQGHAVDGNGADNKDGMPSQTAVALNNGTAVDFGNANGLPLGNRYFSDLATEDGSATPIVITLTITNDSQFDISAKLNLPTNQTYVTFEVDNQEIKIGAKNATDDSDVGTIQITMTLDTTKATTFDLRAIEFELEFAKYEFSLLSLIKGDSTTGYYLEMGEYNGTALRWFPFAKLDEGGNVIATLSDGNFSYKNELTSGSYYFISEKVLTSKAFNSSGYVNDLSKHYGLDYNGSTVQTYITGNMLTEYSIPADDVIYNAITKRTLKGEAYEFYDSNDDLVEDTTGKYVTHDTPDQSLWLLSKTEAGYLESSVNSVASKYGYPVAGGTSAAYWWLRSPRYAYSYGYACAWFVDVRGYVNSDAVGLENRGVRPAFQIQL